MTKELPDFLIIGAAKSGTSSLYRYLKEHPQIFMPDIKEVRYFAYGDGQATADWEERFGSDHFPVKTLDDYKALFAGQDQTLQWGEASPLYLEMEGTAERIKAHIPHAKLIAILRNPVERAFSGYLMQVRVGRTSYEPEVGLTEAAHSVQASYYYDFVKRYYDAFPKEQIQIHRFEDFSKNTAEMTRSVFDFLGVDSSYVPDTEKRHNVGSMPKNKVVHSIFTSNLAKNVLRPLAPQSLVNAAKRVRRLNDGATPKITPEIEARLQGFFEEDIKKLQDLIDQDLSGWLKPAG